MRCKVTVRRKMDGSLTKTALLRHLLKCGDAVQLVWENISVRGPKKMPIYILYDACEVVDFSVSVHTGEACLSRTVTSQFGRTTRNKLPVRLVDTIFSGRNKRIEGL